MGQARGVHLFNDIYMTGGNGEICVLKGLGSV